MVRYQGWRGPTLPLKPDFIHDLSCDEKKSENWSGQRKVEMMRRGPSSRSLS
jgi:hypothetical protein